MKWYDVVMIAIIVAIITAIVVPSLMESRMPSYSTEISALRTLSSVQELYKTRTGVYGDYFDLNDGKDKKYIDPALAKADPDHPQHQDKAGFNIDIFVNSDNTDWWAISTPDSWWEGGHPGMGGLRARNCKITSDGIIRYNETEGDTTNFPYVLGSS